MIDRKEDNQFHLVSKYEPSGDQPQAIETLVDNIKGGGHGKLLELDDNSLTYYGQVFGRKTFEIPLSEIEFVKRAWSTQMEDIERSSTVRYSLKCIEHVFDLMLKLMIKRDIRSCLSSSKMGR